MTKNNIKIVLFASLIVAMILPFSGMMMADATTHENANDKIPTHLQPYVSKILDLVNERNGVNESANKLVIDQKIQEIERQMGEIERERINSFKDTTALNKVESKIRDIDGIPNVNFLRDGNSMSVLLPAEHENQGWNERIRGTYMSTISNTITNSQLDIEILYFTTEYVDYGCNATDDNCDPLQGGIRIENTSGVGCTLGLPVKQGSTTGYLTAGHCFSKGDVYQPEKHWWKDWKIGSLSSGNIIDDADCDCAFVSDTNSRTNDSKVWINSGFSVSITDTDTPTLNKYLFIAGEGSGYWAEKVAETNWTDSERNNIILLESKGIGNFGDSGSPVFDWSGHDIIGIYNGEVTISKNGQPSKTYSVVTSWAKLSDSKDGVGVSLL